MIWRPIWPYSSYGPSSWKHSNYWYTRKGHEKNGVKQYEFYDEKNDELIPEEELEHINPYLDNNFLSSTMNSGIMKIYQNDP